MFHLLLWERCTYGSIVVGWTYVCAIRYTFLFIFVYIFVCSGTGSLLTTMNNRDVVVHLHPLKSFKHMHVVLIYIFLLLFLFCCLLEVSMYSNNMGTKSYKRKFVLPERFWIYNNYDKRKNSLFKQIDCSVVNFFDKLILCNDRKGKTYFATLPSISI